MDLKGFELLLSGQKLKPFTPSYRVSDFGHYVTICRNKKRKDENSPWCEGYWEIYTVWKWEDQLAEEVNYIERKDNKEDEKVFRDNDFSPPALTQIQELIAAAKVMNVYVNLSDTLYDNNEYCGFVVNLEIIE